MPITISNKRETWNIIPDTVFVYVLVVVLQHEKIYIYIQINNNQTLQLNTKFVINKDSIVWLFRRYLTRGMRGEEEEEK